MKYIKSFIKWAGGKNKLLPYFFDHFPKQLLQNKCNYFEPFVGGGVVVFNLIANFHLSNVYICDINKDLINCYKVIKCHVKELIKKLDILNFEYSIANDLIAKKEIFNKYKDQYNQIKADNKDAKITKASLFIFLNHTCFNGLYRVNSSNLFNVPFGKYLHPQIFDKNHLLLLSKLLKHVHIYCAPYFRIKKWFGTNNFAYFDPPYLPSSKTKNFTSYTKENFSLQDQTKLAKFLNLIDSKCLFALSNSAAILDNYDLNKLYSHFNVNICNTVHSISCRGNSRTSHQEVFITNYPINGVVNND